MKKFLSVFLIIATVLSIVLLCSSCDRVVLTEDNFFDVIDKKYNAQKSFQLDLSASFVFYVEGNEIKADADGVIIMDTSRSKHVYYYEKTTTNAVCDALSMNETETAIEAYNDGKFFIYSENKNGKNAIYSEEKSDDFIKYFEASNSTDEFSPDFNDCTNKELIKNEDGTYTYKTSGYTNKTIDLFAKSTDLTSSILDLDINDIEFAITVDKKANLQSGEIKFIFDKNNGKTPEMNISFSCKYGDSIIKITDDINPDDYTKTENILLMKNIELMLNKKYDSESGSFKLDVYQVLLRNSKETTSREVDRVSFKTQNEAFTYDIDVIYDGTELKLSYADGTQTLTAENQTNTAKQTDEEAKEFIKSLMKSIEFSADMLSDVKQTSDNVYRFTIKNPDKTPYQKVYISLAGGYLQSGYGVSEISQTITVTIEEGEIVSIFSNVSTKGKLSATSNTISYTVNTKIEFTDSTDEEAAGE